jgi:hypothetical protein
MKGLLGWGRIPVLMLLCAGLSAVLYLELQDSTKLSPAAHATPQPQGTSDLPRLEEPEPVLPPLATYAAVVERPLFSPSRRAPQLPEPVKRARRAPPLKATLKGVVLAPQRRTALIEIEGANEPRWVAEGQQIEGWTLEAVLAGQIVLRHGDASRELVLHPDEEMPEWRRSRRSR